MTRPESKLLRSTRIWVYGMLFLTGFLHYAIRNALNMSIVCMVVPQQLRSNHTEDMQEVLRNDTWSTPNNPECGQSVSTQKDFGYVGEFYWSRAQVGHILGSFFYAYCPMQVLGGWLADKFGIRHVLGVGMLIGGVLSLLTPPAARMHYGVLIALRALMGLTMGVTAPCIHSVIMKWVPDSERGMFLGVAYSGSSAGIILSFLLSGYLCPYSWTYVFYILGSLTFIWYAVFMYTVYSQPDDHPRITEVEKKYIRETNKRMSSGLPANAKHIPWKSILTSPSVIALCITQFSCVFAYYTINAGIPLFMQDVLYFNIKSNGLLSSLPSLVQIIGNVLVGVLLDVVHRQLIQSRWVLRKSSQSVAVLGAGAFLVAVGYIHCQQRIGGVIMFCLIYVSFSFLRGGHNCAPSDIAPRMSGTVYGVENMVGNLSGFLAPIAIGNLTPTGSQAEWQRLFFITAGVLLAGWLTNMVLVPVEEQSWAKGESVQVEITVLGEGDTTEHLKTFDNDKEVPGKSIAL